MDDHHLAASTRAVNLECSNARLRLGFITRIAVYRDWSVFPGGAAAVSLRSTLSPDRPAFRRMIANILATKAQNIPSKPVKTPFGGLASGHDCWLRSLKWQVSQPTRGSNR